MVTKIYIGDYTNLTIDAMTNLYLYGTINTPPHYEDRLRTKAKYDELRDNPQSTQGKELVITLDMGTYMTSGAGRYVHASEASFVQKFFNNTVPFTLGDGSYTKQLLIDKFIAYFTANGDTTNIATQKANAEFNIQLANYTIDASSSDYAARTYIYNNAGYTISSNAVFVVNGTQRYVQNMAVHAFDDNFDFTTKGGLTDLLAQLGNSLLLKKQIDPYDIGRTVSIEFDPASKANVPVIANYNSAVFAYDHNQAAQVLHDGNLYTALNAMLDVESHLEAVGTIDYDTTDGKIIYGTMGDDNLSGTSGGDILISGDGNDILIGGTGGDQIDGGTGVDTVSYADSASLVNVNLTRTGVQFGGSATGDIISYVENIIGSNFKDVLTGDINNNQLTGGKGDDTLTGGGGYDVFAGNLDGSVDTVMDMEDIDRVSFDGTMVQGWATSTENGLYRLGNVVLPSPQPQIETAPANDNFVDFCNLKVKVA